LDASGETRQARRVQGLLRPCEATQCLASGETGEEVLRSVRRRWGRRWRARTCSAVASLRIPALKNVGNSQSIQHLGSHTYTTEVVHAPPWGSVDSLLADTGQGHPGTSGVGSAVGVRSHLHVVAPVRTLVHVCRQFDPQLACRCRGPTRDELWEREQRGTLQSTSIDISSILLLSKRLKRVRSIVTIMLLKAVTPRRVGTEAHPSHWVGMTSG
jgi:hypothetical protein